MILKYDDKDYGRVSIFKNLEYNDKTENGFIQIFIMRKYKQFNQI